MQTLLDRPSLRDWMDAAGMESEIIEPYEVGRREPPGDGRTLP
jgi:hypothetical protein